MRASLFLAAFAVMCAPVAEAAEFEIFTTSKGISSDAYESIFKDLKDLNANIVLQDNPAIVLPQTDAIIDPRIVGGEITNIEQYPWQAALIFRSLPEPFRSLRCGGSVVDQHWVLTAAHCVDDSNAQDVVSQTTFYKYLGARSEIAKVVVHPSWTRATMENDIALVKTNDVLAVHSIVKLMEDDFELQPGTNVYVTGWGAIFEGGPTSDILRVANMPVVSREECNKPASYNGRIKASMMCAGVREGGLDSCQGDSGGPAISLLNGVPVQVGVVSGGQGCAQRKKYGVYTKVGSYTAWIHETIAAN